MMKTTWQWKYIKRAILLDKRLTLIGVQHILHPLTTRLTSDHSRLKTSYLVMPNKVRKREQIIKALIHNHIRIQIKWYRA